MQGVGPRAHGLADARLNRRQLRPHALLMVAGWALAAGGGYCLTADPAHAQSAAQFLLNPNPDTVAPQDSRFTKKKSARGTAQTTTQDGSPEPAQEDPAAAPPAPSRIGKLPTYDVPPASGAASDGFDSLNRKRKKTKKLPGTPHPAPGAAPMPRADRTPVAAAVAGTVPGQPPRRRLKPDDDPFEPVGFYAGSFLVKSAVELTGGYDTNPARVVGGTGSSYYMLSPELVMTSNWSRHMLNVDLRGSFTNYQSSVSCGCAPGLSSVPNSIDRPDFTGKVNGRIDVTRDTKIDGEARFRVATDNPGSPDIGVNLTRYPLSFSTGGTIGVTQSFNRFEVRASASADRTIFADSQLTNGTRSSNADRDFDQYGGTLRASYDLSPGIKPFVEAGIDERVHDQRLDRNGVARDSRGDNAKVGTTFELTRLLTGEVSIGYQRRTYSDPSLNSMHGLLVDASLIWTATSLTTVTLTAKSTISETTLAGVSGVMTREYGVKVDHTFRRWLIGTAKFSVADGQYQGNALEEKTYLASAGLIYKLNREWQIKGEVKHEWLRSSTPGADYAATVVMLGVRVQR